MDATSLPTRFSLRHLALLVALIAVVLTWYVSPAASGLKKTGGDLDLAIFGKGWFQVNSNDRADFCYTRSGDLAIDNNGNLVVGRVQDGLMLDPQISVPPDWSELHIAPNGMVHAVLGSATSRMCLGQIQLAKFNNPEGLKEILPGIYDETRESGRATICLPGEGAGLLKQGWIENTNAPHPFDLMNFVAFVAVFVSGWTLLEVRKLHQRIDSLH